MLTMLATIMLKMAVLFLQQEVGLVMRQSQRGRQEHANRACSENVDHGCCGGGEVSWFVAPSSSRERLAHGWFVIGQIPET
jgi:hypothetical protein